MIQKIIELKNKTENEINKINELFEKTIDDLTKSFQKKHEALLKEENDIKEKLQNEVTKVKEKLELFLSKTNNEIKINEKINKGIIKFNKEEKNINKILSYVSKINKNQKEINKLLQENLKTLNFNSQEEQSNIKYEDYYFNGIAIPKNIQFDNVTYKSLHLSWKIDNINNINIDNNKIQYIVEMKNEKEQFIQVYKGSNLNCLIDNLKFDNNYEFRICSIYNNDIISPWTNIYIIKRREIIRKVIKNQKKENQKNIQKK